MGYSLNVFVCARACECSGVLPERSWAVTPNMCVRYVYVCVSARARECVCSGVPERSWAVTALGAASSTAATICI